ncbi:hypothetical protein [Bosea sp. BK604]|uniref:hypothetical protein n=1 Tax=Bosea sp. BK604 TaxID=2512180 RepID=UPI001047CC2D|nr:hypothetical protein [Bosea sp. BK604]TCR65681.1 hypothetical protein EV560_105444 [Bosea sp. BK604]
MSMSRTDLVVAPVTVDKSAQSYVQWAPVLGGAVVAAAISTIMTIFGAAIGLSMVSADFARSSSATAFAVAGALWALWITVSSCAAGGYIAGRMRQPAGDANLEERKVRDGTHGLLVWATGALLLGLIATSSVIGTARTAASGAASVGSGAASLISQNIDPLATALDSVMRSNGQQPPTAEERDEASRIFVNALSNGRIEQGDRDYLASRLSARSNISAEDAQKRIDEAYSRLNQAKETAKAAAEKARKIAVLSAFLTAAALLVGAAASVWAAGLGGEHRDENLRAGSTR